MQTAKRPAAPWLALAALSFLGIPLPGCSDRPSAPPFAGDAAFTLVHSQHVLGNIEPCSCNNRTTGGFPRRAALLDAIRKEDRFVLVVDAGNSLFSEDRKLLDPQYLAQAKVKAGAIAEAFVKTGLDAFVFGELELWAGGDFFVETVKRTGLPVVAANVFDRASGEPLFERYKLFDFGGLKVAVFGLVAPELHPSSSEVGTEGTVVYSVNEQKTIVLEDFFKDTKVKIEDPLQTAKDLVPELRSKAHLVIALTHLPEKLANDLPALVPGIEIVVGKHHPTTRPSANVDGVALHLASSMSGTSLGIVELAVKAGNLVFEDYSKLDAARDLVPSIEEMRAAIVKEFGSDDPERIRALDAEAAERFQNLTARLEEYRAMLADMDPEHRSHFRYRSVVLDGKEYKDEPAMKEFIRRYRESLAQLYAAADSRRAPQIEATDKAEHYVGGAACASCHQAQHEFWLGTKHARAWQTMIDYSATHDLECITCHTVGWMQAGGFDRPDRVAGYENVQCENCHGPGSGHLKNVLAPAKTRSDAGVMDCESCHNKEHSPNFRRDTYVPRASCPPLDPWDPLIRGTYGKLREELERTFERQRREGQEAKPHLYSGLVDLYLRLERYEDALRLSQEALVKQPRLQRSMALSTARSLDGLGRTKEALETLQQQLIQDPKEPKVLALIVELLLHGRDPSQRDLAKAREFVEFALDTPDLQDGMFRFHSAEIAYAEGNVEEAITTMKGLMRKTGVKSSVFLERIAAWSAELEARREYAAPPPLARPPAR